MHQTTKTTCIPLVSFVNIFSFFIIFCNGTLLAIIFYYWCLISEKSEPYTELNALVATLSTGPYGPSDMAGHIDYRLINK